MMKRIGVLHTYNGDFEFARLFPNDGEKIGARFKVFRPHWEIEVIPVTEGVIPSTVLAHDAYVITGSPASVNEALPWIEKLGVFIRELHAAQVPTIGLCFGHQAIATALGGTVSPNPGGWGLGIGSMQFERQEFWMAPQRDRAVLYAAHNEQVTALPPEAKRLGGDAFCPVGSFTVGDHFFTTQFHPEFSEEFMMAMIDYMSTQVDASVIANARLRLRQTVDADLFVGWMVQFMEMTRPRKK
jgi:GMP synthase-like glutamine amidotransferase